MTPVEKLVPVEERQELAEKARVAFIMELNDLLRVWRRFSDHLRGTLVNAYNRFILLNHNRPDIIHVSDIVRHVIYGESSEFTILDEERLRVMVRGLLYHHYFRKRIALKAPVCAEFPVAGSIGPYIVVGTVDLLVPMDEGYILVEVKSSASEETKGYGILQTKIYWLLLETFSQLKILEAYVSTPKEDVPVDGPLRPRELKRLVASYIKQARRDLENHVEELIQVPA